MVLTVIVVAVLLISVIAGTYAFFTATVNDSTSDTVTVTSGSLSLTLNDMDVTSLTTWNITPSDLSRTVYIRLTNNSPISVDARILFRGLTNTYSEYLVYTVEEVNSNKTSLSTPNILIDQKRVPASTSASNKTMVNRITLASNTTKYYKVTIQYLYSTTINQSSDVGKTFYTGFGLEENTSPLSSEEIFNVLNLTLGSGTPDFNNISPGDGTVGVYTATDDYGTSYYFRGNVTNNYVKFGKNASNQDMYWRIVRINGDGSLRLIYDGTQAYANDTSNSARLIATNVKFNEYNNDAKYVGYMYGGAAGVASTSYAGATANETDSTIKIYLDNWYVTNIKNTGYESYLSDETFCNDRSVNKAGYGNSDTNYGAYYVAYNRLFTNKTPSLICPQKNDAFTVNDTIKGNGALTNPIGLLTADEASYAGGKWGTNNVSYYLYKGSWYWLGSPFEFNTKHGDVHMFQVSAQINHTCVDTNSGVVPVINLSATTAQSLVGSGTASTPYQLP